MVVNIPFSFVVKLLSESVVVKHIVKQNRWKSIEFITKSSLKKVFVFKRLFFACLFYVLAVHLSNLKERLNRFSK